MEGGFPGTSSDWGTILGMLKSDDEMLVYQGAMELRDSLSYAQENQMQGFTTEQFMNILVKIVTRDAITDLSNEVKFFAIQCLTTLMDIFPTLVNALVNAGLAKGMATVMQTSIGFIDLSEACIKAFDKISQENPPAILKCGAIGVILEQMDFFESQVQDRIFKIIQRVARHSSTEQDFDANLRPVLPMLLMNLQVDMTDKKRLEDVSKIVFEIQESFSLYLSPTNDFNKVSEQYDKLNEFGVYNVLLAHVKNYAEIAQKQQELRAAQQDSPSKAKQGDPSTMEIDEEEKKGDDNQGEPGGSSLIQIDSSNSNHTISHQTILNFFKILENACKYSSEVANQIFGESELFEDLAPFLPNDCSGQKKQYNSEDFPLINEAIGLLSTVLSEKEEAEADKSPEESKEGPSPFQRRMKVRREFEAKKRAYQVAPERQEKVVTIAESLLPRILFVYESTINPQFRIKTLAVIDKMISLLNDELLRSFIEPKQFANFIYQIIQSKHSSSIDMSLKITRKVLDCSPLTHALPLIREGVSQFVADLSTPEKFKKFMCIAQDVDIASKQFDLDIHEVKEALHQTRIYSPDDHQARDFYERRLLELVERQKYAASKTAAKKEGSPEKKESADEGKDNVAVRIINEAQGILARYFENPAFISELENSSEATKVQLNLKAELNKLSEELCNEATQLQQTMDELANVRRLLTRVCDLITLEEHAITRHEFKHSKLLQALELLLTKTPSQAKLLLQKRQRDDRGEEMKHSEEIELMEAQKQSTKVTKRESRCLMHRLKLLAHIILIKKPGQKNTPLRALIEINHQVIAEHDSFILAGGQNGPAAAGYGHGGPPLSFLGYPPGGPGMPPLGSGDYEHCVSALRQLQKRVTVNLVYDPAKTFLEEKTKEKATKRASKKPAAEQAKVEEPKEDNGDSVMEDMTPSSSLIEEKPEDEALLEDELNLAPGQAPLGKAKSAHPALLKLAASPQKGLATEQEKRLVNQTKVYLKRHHLYSELKQIPVTVEQSSCLQILEDFLRNRVRTMDHVKGLKFDYGFGGLGGFPGGGPPGSSPFGSAFGGHYQSITQKILRKNLGNQARKLLDGANDRLTKILNAGPALRLGSRKVGGKKAKKIEDGYDEEMDEGLDEDKSAGKKSQEEEDAGKDRGSDEDQEDNNSQKSNQFDDMEEDEEEDEELDEEEAAARAEKERLLDLFVEELPDEIISSGLPEEQQHMLVKILTRQHAFMMDQLKMNVEDAHALGGGGEEDEDGALAEEELCRMEERLEDFSETMERVHARFMDKKADQRDKKKQTQYKEALEKDKLIIVEEEEKSKEEAKQPADGEGADHEMEDLTEGLEEKPKGSGKPALSSEQIALSDEKLEGLAKDKEDDVDKVEGEIDALEQLEATQPKLKLKSNDKDAEMIKPADQSDSEVLDENEESSLVAKEKKAEQSLQAVAEDATAELQLQSMLASKERMDQLIEKECLEQDKKIQRALDKERDLRQRMREAQEGGPAAGLFAGAPALSQQTKELLELDLEELIKRQGEDVDFEFYFEGKLIQPAQTIFEIIKDSETKRKDAERAFQRSEQIRLIKEKETELKLKAKKISESKTEKNEEERDRLKKESDRLKELFEQMSSQFGPPPGFPGSKGGPPGFLSFTNAHKICFCIKDKTDDLAAFERERLDSLAELTAPAKRQRTKSEAVQDISGQAINEFVLNILEQEFRVFEVSPSDAKLKEESTKQEAPAGEADEELEIKSALVPTTSDAKAAGSQKLLESKRASLEREKSQLEQSLKVLKVLNFLGNNQDLISGQGLRLIMKSSSSGDDDGFPTKSGSPGKHEGLSQGEDFEEPGFSDADLLAGFSEVSPALYHHQKLDSYLQKSVKDPYNLVQGAISPNLQQIFKNCPFLFPFATKQLYFKLVSFISAVDVHRAIYFLRQYMRQHSGGQKAQGSEKDNLKKIAKQKVVIRRDSLIPSAFTLLPKIDKRSFMEFEFEGEEGTGLGPTLEFYDNIADEFKTWSTKIREKDEAKGVTELTHPMWRHAGENLLFPAPVCLKTFSQEKIKEVYEVFRLCGTLVAKAVVDDRQIDLAISPLFWRLCLGAQMTIFDVQKLLVDPVNDSLYRTLAELQVVANKAADIERHCAEKELSAETREGWLQALTVFGKCKVEDLGMVFVLPNSGESEIELVPGGASREVTLENAQDYVDLVLHYLFHETVKIQVQAFRKGFDSIFPITSLAPFTHPSSQEGELETVVCGIGCREPEWESKEELCRVITPQHGFDENSAQYRHFIRYITELVPEKRPAFVKFLTGSKRLPTGGFKSLDPRLTLSLTPARPGQGPNEILPSVMACRNYVKCPQYSSYELLKARFDYAVAEGQQSFSLS